MAPDRHVYSWPQAIALFVAAAGNALVGLWAVLTPLGFYTDFPGAGQHWVAMAGAYDEHLVLDVGWLSLTLTVMLLVALWKREIVLVRTASVAALIFAGPHFAYHANHLENFSTTEASLELLSLAITVAAPLISLVTTLPRQRRAGLARPRKPR